MQKIELNLNETKTSLFVISISSPILIGIYSDGVLEGTIKSDGKTSDILPNIIDGILKNRQIDELIYVNGPGSYMSIKLAYIFLKTLSITKNMNFFAISGFQTNKNSPIKALGKKYFVLNSDGNIDVRFLEENEKIDEFMLPDKIDYNKCSNDTLPNYQLPAV
jgi:tRNA A37 threonylcarbamoyladenosine modification protein TsaB